MNTNYQIVPSQLKNLQFRKPQLTDVDCISRVLKHNRFQSCDFCTGNIVLWSHFYHTEFAIIDDFIIFRQRKTDQSVQYTFPIGASEHKRYYFDLLLSDFDRRHQRPVFFLISPDQAEMIDSWYPGQFVYEYNRDYADYIYSRESLATLAGKKLHGKRNHIHRFEENHPEWTYETINIQNASDCACMLDQWLKDYPNVTEDVLSESEIIKRALSNLSLLPLIGGLIRTKDGVVAFTLGEPVTDDTFVIHFEKAFADIPGAYPMINREFVRQELSLYTFINREEDLGLDGLRRSKLSYQPDLLLNKGILTER